MRFSDFVTLQRGYDLTRANMRPGPYPVVGSTSIVGHHDEFKVDPPGVITGRSGSLGKVQYIEEPYWPHNTSLWVRDFKGNDPRFVYYCMKGIDFARFNAGAGVPTLNRNHLDSLEVDAPPLPVQRRIAGILSGYDELIENSQRRIRILEAMARALFREWFVHFRFPGHENHPRAPSPLGEIPEGWEVANLESVKSEQPHAINGGPFGSKLGRKDYVADGVPVIRGSNLSETGRFDASSFAFVSDQKADDLRANLASPGDIVVTQRGTLGQIGMIPTGIGYDRFVISQSQMKITLNLDKVSREYVFFFFRSDEARQRIKNLASSSGVPHINLATLREFQVLLPPFELQRKFGRFALSTEATIEALQGRIHNLRRTRDLLLPRLLSGQIELEVA